MPSLQSSSGPPIPFAQSTFPFASSFAMDTSCKPAAWNVVTPKLIVPSKCPVTSRLPDGSTAICSPDEEDIGTGKPLLQMPVPLQLEEPSQLSSSGVAH